MTADREDSAEGAGAQAPKDHPTARIEVVLHGLDGPDITDIVVIYRRPWRPFRGDPVVLGGSVSVALDRAGYVAGGASHADALERLRHLQEQVLEREKDGHG